MLPLNPKKTGSRGCLQSFCFSLWLLFIFSPSQRTRRFYFKAYWQLQQHLMVPEHSSVHRSRCHITALGMVSEGRAEQERNPSRSRIPAGFVSPADSSISDPRPPLLMPEGRDQERDPKCLCSWGGCRRRRSLCGKPRISWSGHPSPWGVSGGGRAGPKSPTARWSSKPCPWPSPVGSASPEWLGG